ncbi:MAG TPA: DUF3006 domain-containing protein [Desulfotomaculum sp.]|nr:MAG: hypothetical protein JL56_04795 [Desulfotomaculum sp. BICA1-6]KUO64586.1 MAG: hypothetical protein APF84_03955 [Gracilibacter sp. BRH_c7a]HBX23659.1 DUF3006 domain-containing protein [Desulfotomaculum sp.]
MTQYTIDSITDNKARILLRADESKSLVIDLVELPPNIKEGDIIELTIDGQRVLDAKVLTDATTAAKKRVETLLEKLKNKNK